jgi:L-threonylcarbamoyladenylate synthase
VQHVSAILGTDPNEAARLLRRGEPVAIPTETVYGLAANAFDPEAVLRVFAIKGRPSFDPLIVHIGQKEQSNTLVEAVSDEAHALMDRFWPGPLTLVLPKRSSVPDIVTSGLDTVGVRMPAHPLTLRLLRSLDFPLAAPSANPFGYVSPTSAQHVMDRLGDRIPYILDGGPCNVGVESTIIGWEGGRPVVYRAGGVPTERIEEVIGRVGGASRSAIPLAPGMLAGHYAPRKPVRVGDVPAMLKANTANQVGVISLAKDFGASFNEVLSAKGDLHEAARNLFAALRRLDASAAEVIFAEVFPEEGLGRAINDRLQRASAAR